MRRLLCLVAALALGLAVEARAQTADERFAAGMAAIEAGRHDEAIAHFRAMLVDDPSLVRVRLELARADAQHRRAERGRMRARACLPCRFAAFRHGWVLSCRQPHRLGYGLNVTVEIL